VSVISGRRTLINDEIWYLINARLSVEEYVATLRLDLTHPPLMYLLNQLVMNTFGHTDAVVKLFVAVIGAGSIAAFTVLSSLVLKSWRLYSVLFCTAYLQVGGVPNLARGYSLGLLLTIIALLAWEFWRRRPRPIFLGVWAVAMLALVYTHYVGLLLLVPFVIANWWYGHRRWLFSMVACAVAAGFVPWLAAVLPVYLSRGLAENLGWIRLSPLESLATLPFHLLSYLPSGWNPLAENDWPRALNGKRVLVVLALALHATMVALVLRQVARLWPPSATHTTAAVWLWSALVLVIMPVAALFLFSVALHPVLDARFIAFLLPMYWLLVGLAAELGGRPVRRVVHLAVVPWLLVSVTVPLARSVQDGLHHSVRVVHRELQPGELVLAERLAGPQVHWEWTRTFGRSEPVVIVSDIRPAWTPRETPLTRLHEVNLSGIERVWFFWTAHNPDNVADIRAHVVAQGFRELAEPPGGPRPFLSVFDRRQ
jgi:hypothetical protein